MNSSPRLTMTSSSGARLVFAASKRLVLQLAPVIRASVGTGGGATSQQFNQPTPAITWTINHNLGRTPIVQVFSVGGMELLAEIVNLNVNQTQVRFASPTAGYARLI